MSTLWIKSFFLYLKNKEFKDKSGCEILFLTNLYEDLKNLSRFWVKKIEELFGS